MRKTFHVLILAALTAATPAVLTRAIGAEAAAAAAHYSVETTLVGKMLDDPTVNALLKKMIPSVYNNEMFQSMGRDPLVALLGEQIGQRVLKSGDAANLLTSPGVSPFSRSATRNAPI